MRVDLFEKLSEGFEPKAAATLSENLRCGFPLGVQEAPSPRSWAPSYMYDRSRTSIMSYFEAEVTCKRMLGPFTTPPPSPSGEYWEKTVTFPVSEVEKSDGKFRTIFNLSYDWEISANAGILKSEAFTTYTSFERMAAEMTEVGFKTSILQCSMWKQLSDSFEFGRRTGSTR